MPKRRQIAAPPRGDQQDRHALVAVDALVSIPDRQKGHMKTATPQLDWSLFVECPECGEDFDLKDREEESEFSKPIFNNAWDDIKGMEVDCPKCKSTFSLDKVEY